MAENIVPIKAAREPVKTRPHNNTNIEKISKNFILFFIFLFLRKTFMNCKIISNESIAAKWFALILLPKKLINDNLPFIPIYEKHIT